METHPNITYVPSIDSSFVTGSVYNEAYLGYWVVANSVENERVAGLWTNYTTRHGDMQRINKHKLILKNNTYDHNHAGSMRSIVEAAGFYLVESIDEKYSGNENWWEESYADSIN